MSRACCNAPASSTCRNARTFGSRWRIAWRNAAVSASADVSPRDNESSSAAAGRSIMVGSVQNGGDAVEIAGALGGVGQRLVNGQGRRRLVGPEDVRDVQRMRQWLDALGIDLLQLGDVINDATELAGHGLGLGIGQFQTR